MATVEKAKVPTRDDYVGHPARDRQYMLIAIYAGWPLPRTASEREHATDLRFIEAHALRVDDGRIVFQVAFRNDGRGDVENALVNVVVPRRLEYLHRVRENGTSHPDDGGRSETDEYLPGGDEMSLYRNGNITFPGRISRIAYFAGAMSLQHDFPIRIKPCGPTPARGEGQAASLR